MIVINRRPRTILVAGYCSSFSQKGVERPGSLSSLGVIQAGEEAIVGVEPAFYRAGVEAIFPKNGTKMPL